MYDIIIIGGGPAGMTAALYGLRAGKSVLVLEGNGFGGQIALSHRVENFPGTKVMSGNEFADQLLDQIMSLGAEVEFTTVLSIEDDKEYKRVLTEDSEYECKALIIATGSKARRLGLEHETDLIGKGVSYCAVCDGAFFKGSDVAVIGGGSTALTDAMFLSEYSHKVYIVHRRDAFRGEDDLVSKLEKIENVELVLDSVVESIQGVNSLEAIELRNVKTNEKTKIAVEGMFVAVGQEPNTKMFEGIVELDEYGYIRADELCHTNIEGIFVAGDCRTKNVRQLTTAVSDGSIAALAACDYINRA